MSNASHYEESTVALRFDNKGFESGIKSSLNVLDKLKASLQFDKLQTNTEKAFTNLSKAAANVDFSALFSAIENTGNKFSVMGIAATRVIQNMTDSAMRAASNLVNAVKEPLVQGGIARAMNIEQATFMLKGLGLDVEAIKKNAMDAVDGTAYGFDEAAKVAAQFGASGMQAGDQMYHALLGVAGAAAMTGRSFEDIGGIFTTVASNGKLMTQQLRQFSFSGLNVSSTLAKELGKTEEEINEMVSKGKISFDQFSDAMYSAFGEHAQSANETFSGALSNMKAALKQIGQTVALPAMDDMRLMFLDIRKYIKDLQPMLKPLESTLASIIEQGTLWVRDFFNGIDRSKSAAVIMDFWGAANKLLLLLQDIDKFLKSADFTRMTGKFKVALNALKVTIESYIKPIKQAFLETFGDLVNLFSDPYADMMNFIKGFTEIVRWFRLSDEQGKKVHDAFKSIFDVLRYGIGALTNYKDVFGGWVKTIGDMFGDFITGQTRLNKWLSEVFESLQNGTKKIYDLIPGGKKVVDFFRSMAKTISEFVTNVLDFGQELTHTFATSFTLGTLVDIVKAGIFTTFVDTITGGMSSIANAFDKSQRSIDSIYNSINSVLRLPQKLAGLLDSVRFALVAYQNELKAKSLMEIGKAMIALGAGLALMASVDSDKMEQATTTMIEILYGITGAMTLLSKLTTPTMDFSREAGIFSIYFAFQNLINGLSTITTASALYVTLMAMKQLAYAMIVIAAALKILATMSWDEITRGLVALGGALTEFLGAMAIVKLIDPAGIETKGLMGLAATMYVMGMALKKMGSLQWDEIAKGLIGMTGAMGALLLFVKLLGGSEFESGMLLNSKGLLSLKQGKSPIDMSTAFSFIILAGALELIALELQQIGQMDPAQLGQGIFVMTVMLTELALFSKVLEGGEKLHYDSAIKKAASLVIVAVAIEILVDAFGKIANTIKGYSEDTVGQSLETMAVLLLGLGGVLVAMEKLKVDPGRALGTAASMLIVSFALSNIANALTGLTSLDPDNLFKATVSMGLVVAELCIILERLGKVKAGGLAGALSLVLLSGALVGIAVALQMVSVLGPAAILGAVALGGLLAVIALIGSKITLEMVTRIQLMAAALLEMSFSILLVGAAVAAPIAAIAYLIDAFARLINVIKSAPDSMGALGEAFSTLFTSVLLAAVNNLNTIATSLVDTLLGVLEKLLDKSSELIPKFLDVIELILTESFAVLEKSAVPFISALEKIALQLLETLDHLIDPLLNVLTHLVEGLLDFLAQIFPDIVDKLGKMVDDLLGGLAKWLPTWLNSLVLLLIAFNHGLAAAILNNQDEIVNSVSEVVTSIIVLIPAILLGAIDGIVNAGKVLFGEGGLIAGIKARLALIGVWAKKIITELKEKIEAGKERIKQAAKNIIQGFVNGIMENLYRVIESGRRIGETVLNAAKNFLGIESPSKEFMKVGMFVDMGLAEGIERNGHIPEDAILTVAGHMIGAMGGVIDKADETGKYLGKALGAVPDMNAGEKYILQLYKESGAYDELKENLVEVNTEYDELTGHLNDLKTEYSTYRGQKNYLGPAFEDIAFDLGAVTLGLDALREEQKALNTEYADLDTQINKRNEEIAEMVDQLGKVSEAEKESLTNQINLRHELNAAARVRQGEINDRRTIIAEEEERWAKQQSQLERSQRSLEQLKLDRKIAAEWIYDYENELEALNKRYNEQEDIYKKAEENQKKYADELKEIDDLKQKEKRTAEENAQLKKLEAEATAKNTRRLEEEARATMFVSKQSMDELKKRIDHVTALKEATEEEQENREKDIEHQEKLLEEIDKEEEKLAENRQKREELLKKAKKDAIAALQKERDEIAKTIQEYISLGKMSLETNIDLLKGFEKVSTNFFDGFSGINEIFSEFTKNEKDLVGGFENGFNEKWEKGPESLLTYMKNQLTGDDEFEKQLQELLVRNVDEGLVEQIRTLGKGSKQLDIFLNMTEDQINEANAMFRQTFDDNVDAMLSGMRKKVHGDKEFEEQLNSLLKNNVDAGLVEQIRALGAGSDELKLFLNMTKSQIDEANGIFKEMQDKNIKDMLANMNQQLSGNAEFEEQLDSLLVKNVEKGLVDQLRALGAGSEQLKLFLQMNASQIDEANAMYRESQRKNADAMIKSMEKQFTDAAEFEANLETLRKRGFKEGIIDMLRDLGVGSDELNAFLEMDDAQKAQANNAFIQNERLKSQVLIESMKTQRQAVEDWAKKIQELEERNVSKALLKELVDAGPESQELLNAIYGMTASELQEFSDMYQDSFDFSNEIAEGIQKSYVSALNKAGEFDDIGLSLVKGVVDGINDHAVDVETETLQMVSDAYNAACAELGIGTTNSSDAFADVGAAMDQGEIDGMIREAPRVDEQAIMVVRQSNADADKEAWGTVTVGQHMCQGMVNGINAGQSGVVNAAVNTAVAAYRAACATLEINSPSKLFAELGKFVSMGFAKGIDDNRDLAEVSAEEMGYSTLDNLRNTISQINEIVSGELRDPVIRPTIDTSDISRKAGMLNSLFEDKRIDIDASGSAGSEENKNGNTIVFNQNNYSPKALRSVEIYRQTNNQLRNIKTALNRR